MVIIKGMSLPMDCKDCLLSTKDEDSILCWCNITELEVDVMSPSRPMSCPLEEVD